MQLGNCGVKGAYRLFRESKKINMEGEFSKIMSVQKLWRSLWSMQLLSKIKIFAWEACKENLSTKHNLKRRRVLNEEMCQICGTEVKDATHALCYYPTIQECWDKYLLMVRLVDSHKQYGDIAIYLSGMGARKTSTFSF